MGRRNRWRAALVAFGVLAACSGGDVREELSDEPGTTTTTTGDADPEPTTTTAAAPTGAPNVAGRRDLTLEQDGMTRSFIVYTPELAVGDEAAPVVFMLHGTSGDGERFFGNSGWVELADQEGMVVVFPTATTNCFFEDENGDGDFDDAAEAKFTTKWNGGQFELDRFRLCTPEEVAALPPARQAEADHPVPDDTELIRRILDEVLAVEYSVDLDRVYVTGFSNGGQMAARLAVELDDRVAAVGVAAGTLSFDAEPAADPVPVLYSVGAIDDRFTPVNGGQPLPIDASVLDLGFFQQQRDRFLTLLGLGPEFTVEEDPSGSNRFVQLVWGAPPVELRIVVIAGLGHAYPNAAPTFLWAFFERFSLAD